MKIHFEVNLVPFVTFLLKTLAYLILNVILN